MKTTEGFRTTEFWLVVLALVAATILMITGDIKEDTWKFIASAAVVGYPIGRGIAKS